MLLDINLLKYMIYEDMKVEIFDDIDSTTSYLERQNILNKYHVCLSESQSSGKGRSTNSWVSPFGENIYFSLKTLLKVNVRLLSSFSLIIAAITADFFKMMFPFLDIKVKWPNDILVNNEKLAGILVNSKIYAKSLSQIIIGIGINVNMTNNKNINNSWHSIKRTTKKTVNRNLILLLLVPKILTAIKQFEKYGLSFFLILYTQYDFFLGKNITLNFNNDIFVDGAYQGIDQFGRIILKSFEKLRFFSSAEVSILRLS